MWEINPDFRRVGREARGAGCEEEQQQRQDLHHAGCGNEDGVDTGGESSVRDSLGGGESGKTGRRNPVQSASHRSPFSLLMAKGAWALV